MVETSVPPHLGKVPGRTGRLRSFIVIATCARIPLEKLDNQSIAGVYDWEKPKQRQLYMHNDKHINFKFALLQVLSGIFNTNFE